MPLLYAVVINDLREDGQETFTELGKVQILYDTDGSYHDGELGYYGLYIDGNECMVGNVHNDTGLQISVVRGDEAVDTVKFVYTVDPETMIVNTSATNRW